MCQQHLHSVIFCVMNADCACYLGAITNTTTFMSLLMKTNEPAKRKILWKAEWTKSIAVVASIWIYSAKRTRRTQKNLLKMLDKRVESVILIKLKALLLQNAMQSVRLMFHSILTDGRTVLICHNFTTAFELETICRNWQPYFIWLKFTLSII